MGNYRKTYFEKNPSNHGWYTCVHCGSKYRKGNMDIDHIIPKSKGGSDSEWNLQCLCIHCNRSKQANISKIFSDRVKSADRIISREIKNSQLGGLFGRKK